MKIKEILTEYWGFASFRPMQEEIIRSVLDGKDTLALLPTGGGKSVCFQVPALAREGICLVISPLIALMKDQIDNLRKRRIYAEAIFSGMHPNEVEMIYNRMVFDKKFKFLYVSPERLQNDQFIENVKRMQLNLIAVDEAHCISQWGYDFRPPYLKISDMREYFPKVPFLALTATATPDVVKDIQEKLLFSEENVFRTSFERKNLSYIVLNEENKHERILKVIGNVGGSGIIYVRNRKKTQEVAEFLKSRGVSAEFYHAGLDARQRMLKQENWLKNRCRVMVATNAFGMGIDKPDVRYVIHIDIPDSLEAYFQEAGRGGRDLKRSYAVMFYDEQDYISLKKSIEQQFPSLDFIRTVYNSLCNFLQIPEGGGQDQAFDADLSLFCKNYNLPFAGVNVALRFLEREGLLTLSAAFENPSLLYIKLDNEGFYRFILENPPYESFLKFLVRSYPGLFSNFIKINEGEISRKTGISESDTRKLLARLETLEVVSYRPQNNHPQIIFSTGRMDSRHLSLSAGVYSERKKTAFAKLESVTEYINTKKCRSIQLLNYFGEKSLNRCGRCDICIKRNRIEVNEMEFDMILKKIKPLLKSRPMSMEELQDLCGGISSDKLLNVVLWLSEQEKIVYEKDRKLRWSKN